MTSKVFNNKVKEICTKFGLTLNESYQGTHFQYEIETIFGKLTVSPSPSPRIKLYTVYMRFHGFDLQRFKEVEGGVLPSSNGKWNLHSECIDEVLDTLIERLDNMAWLTKQYESVDYKPQDGFDVSDYIHNIQGNLCVDKHEELVNKNVYYSKECYGVHKVLGWNKERAEYLLEHESGGKFYSNPFRVKLIKPNTRS